jgi:predicted permease
VGSYGRSLWILLGGAGLVLLIACSNVANLLLARAAARAGDMAVRTALGATRRQVVGHMLAEGLVLGVLGGAGGLALAWVALSRVQALAPADLPRLDEVGMSAATLIFVVAASLLTPLVFGLVPALRAAALDVRGVLARGGRSPSVDHGRGRLAAALIAAETALSLILVIGAALLARSVWNLQGVDPGFRAAGVLTFQVTVPPPPGGPAADAPDLYDELWRTIASVQGVEASGGIHVLPLGAGNNRYPFWAEDNEPPAGSLAPVANIRVATPGYLDALGIGLLEGRWFAVDDRMEATPVLALNRTLARRLWPGESALGKRVRLLDGNAFEWEVVGVIEDVRQMALASEPSAEIYLPHAQWGAPGGAMFVTVRSAGRAEAPWPGLERAIQALDPGIVTARVATMEQVVSASLAAPRFLAGLVTTFGALALALAAVGVYGVMSQAVGRRVPELGIRMALGSSRAQALRVSMARGLLPVGVGLAVGLCAAWGATRVLGALLYGVEATDPLTYAAVAAMLATVATLACWLPAWRAVRAAPLAALREG